MARYKFYIVLYCIVLYSQLLELTLFIIYSLKTNKVILYWLNILEFIYSFEFCMFAETGNLHSDFSVTCKKVVNNLYL